jgi:thiamine-monophosphate kinase
VALGAALRGVAAAAIDVSDGLVGDLGHILARSGVGARIALAQLPRSEALDAKLRSPERQAALGWLLAGGDDYELCFTAPVAKRDAVAAAARDSATAVARIGRITATRGLVADDEHGAPLPALPRAFDHFAGDDPAPATGAPLR